MSDRVHARLPSLHEPINCWPAVTHLQSLFSPISVKLNEFSPKLAGCLHSNSPVNLIPKKNKFSCDNMFIIAAVSDWFRSFDWCYSSSQYPMLCNFSAVGALELYLIVSFSVYRPWQMWLETQKKSEEQSFTTSPGLRRRSVATSTPR